MKVWLVMYLKMYFLFLMYMFFFVNLVKVYEV